MRIIRYILIVICVVSAFFIGILYADKKNDTILSYKKDDYDITSHPNGLIMINKSDSSLIIMDDSIVFHIFEMQLEKMWDNTNISLEQSKSLRIYKLINKYSIEYNIPKHIAFNVAYLETTYRGPFDWDYKGNLKSMVGALGVMQIMPSTARHIISNINKHELLYNDELNIMISMELMSSLYDKYNDWEKVCACYNTGKPISNRYSKLCNTEDYKKNWIMNPISS